MQRTFFNARTPALVAAVCWLAPASFGAELAQDKFYRAYYLEHSDGNLKAAVELYGAVVADTKADPQLKAQAQTRLAACREELVSSDLAQLMPPDTLAYLEINRPGDKLLKLLDKLGLLAHPNEPAPEGGRRVAISPALVQEIAGIRGAAVAITGFDPFKQMPSGVVVFHPGSVEVIRGAIETGLPIGGKATKPIEGFQTYEIEVDDGATITVTLTSRLVVASMQRPQIVSVLKRLKGEDKSTLAGSGALADVMKDRADAGLFFFVNAKPVMPLLNGLLANAAAHDRGAAVAQAAFDLNSLQSLSGRAGVNDDGLFFDISLRLDKGHRNLVYNLFRAPPIDRAVLKSIPEGVAAFLVGSLNEPSSRFRENAPAAADAPPIVTLMDFGRELFGNVVSYAVFALPPNEKGGTAGLPIPDAALVLSVNDPAKSEALWTQMLGLAGMAFGAASLEGIPVEIEGVKARSFNFPAGVTVYFATSGNQILLAPAQTAIARALAAHRGGKSVTTDAAFAKSIARIGADTCSACFIHAGRCAELSKAFMSPRDIAEMEPFTGRLKETVASVVVDSSAERFRFSAMLTGIPRIADLITLLVLDEQLQAEAEGRLAAAVQRQNWGEAQKLIDSQLVAHPGDLASLQQKFRLLAIRKKDRAAALVCADEIVKQMGDDANALNTFAWKLLIEEKLEGAYDDLALKVSQRSNELSGQRNWMYVDTLALATFRSGDVKSAVELQKKAIELAGRNANPDLQKARARYEAASKGSPES